MRELEQIRGFIHLVGRRLRRDVALRAAAAAFAAACVAIAGLALMARAVGPADLWPPLTTGVLLLITGSALVVGWWLPRRRWRRALRLARFIEQHVPALGSDLVSAVELGAAREITGARQGLASAGLEDAFFTSVWLKVRELRPDALVAPRRMRQSAAVAAAAGALLAIATLLSPGVLGRGLSLLGRKPTRFEGAAVSSEPLVSDVRITYRYPAYTGLPARTVEGSSGDVVALKGTVAELSMRALRSARKAAFLLGEDGEAGELPGVSLAGGVVRATLRVDGPGTYRVWLAPYLGRPVREQSSHRIEAEPDLPPRVEISAASDRISLQTPRPLEVGFSAHDDFGLGAVDLVFRADNGPERRVRLREAAGERATQGKTVWKPPFAELAPGARVTYRIEASDNDTISGPKVGSSRTLTLVVENPHETFDERLDRQREVLEALMGTLADRLELGGAAAAAKAGETSGDRIEAWARAHDAEEGQVASLARVIEEERQHGGSKGLTAALTKVADRLSRGLRDEERALAVARARLSSLSLRNGPALAAVASKVDAEGVRQTGELETAVLLLDDLIGRQRLEDLAELGRELTDMYKRLEDLLARYNATHDENLRRELERQLRDLRNRIAELGRKAAELQARNEVPAEWQNMPDLREAAEATRKLDQLLEKGDNKSMQQALAELQRSLLAVKNQLERNADEFGEERFPQERKALAELMKKVGDLEDDERQLAGDTGTLSAELEQEARKRAGAELQQRLSELAQKAKGLNEKLAASAPRGLGETSQEELAKARESAGRMARLLESRDLGEAKAEAGRAAAGLERLERAAKRQAARSGSAQMPPLEQFGSSMNQAAGSARELAEEIAKLIPEQSQAASAEQRARGQALGSRQQAIEQRTRELAGEAGKKAGELPGLEKAEGELREAAEQMAKAQGQLGKGSARDANGNQRDAVERLARLRESMQGQREGGGGRHDQEPVRIPGADDTRAPREWRQELLEAMREKAPEKWREAVRRYYEELVK